MTPDPSHFLPRAETESVAEYPGQREQICNLSVNERWMEAMLETSQEDIVYFAVNWKVPLPT